ncbi:MAG: hypothetical protein M3371_09685 [Acidobacteriota bacterium]|nr:hypothetical protein [Acidobacteriota bacterium]
MSQSTVRVLAESHGLALSAESSVRVQMPATGVSLLVAELDGSQVPCVEYGTGAGDKRKRLGLLLA